MITRRSFVGAACAALGVRAQSQEGAEAVKRDMIVRSVRPQDLEMPLSGFADSITPVEHFFVRTHVYAPAVKLGEWRLRVEGEVSSPLSLTMDDLRQFPATEVVAVLECAGNGRSFYEPTVAGIQWSTGATGNGRWRGVRLANVLKRAGLKSTSAQVLFDGADAPIGGMADFQRTIPVSKALDPATLLAFELNGAPLPAQHGFPLRAVVPGWAGDSWMKWVTTVRVLDKEFDGWWMKNAYRHPGRAVPPGAVIPQDAMRPLESLRVKSVIASPAHRSPVEAEKATVIRGAAWSGEGGPITAVDVSVDAGRSWRAARLIAAPTRYGWRQWELPWTPSNEGYYTVMARARDRSGDSQPLAQEWNPSGYLWNVAPQVGIEAVKQVQATAQPIEREAALAPPQAMSACTSCHGEDMIRQQRLTRAQWDRELNKMAGWMPAGTQPSAEAREAILNYLSATFGPGRP